MIPSDILLPNIPQHTHKGEFGRVLIAGGSSEYYGAPILTALGAEYSGADLITLYIPEEHLSSAKNYSLNLFLKPFLKSILTVEDAKNIIQSAKSNHVLVIGNGIGKNIDSQNAILEVLKIVSIPVVLDAESLFPEIFNLNVSKTHWILTPHQSEFERVCQVPFSIENLKQKSDFYQCTFLVKGVVDYIGHCGEIYENLTGCVEMRVGGTGDVLAGIVASYRSQGLNNLEAVRSATYFYGKAGEILAKKQKSFSARSLAKYYPKSLIL